MISHDIQTIIDFNRCVDVELIQQGMGFNWVIHLKQSKKKQQKKKKILVLYLLLLELLLSFIKSMAALETALSSFTSTPPKSRQLPHSLSCLRPHISTSIPTLSLKFPPLLHYPLSIHPIRKLGLKVGTAVEEEVAVEQQVEEEEEEDEDEQEIINLKKKLFVLNLPWSFTVVDVKNLFGECGTVSDVEVLSLSYIAICVFICFCVQICMQCY